MNAIRLFLILLIGSIMISNNDINSKDKSILRIGIDPILPPASYIKNSKLTGFYIQISKFIANELKYAIEFKEMKFASLIPALDNNMVDIVFLSITDQRKEKINFSKPFGFTSYSIMFLKNSDIQTNIKKLENKKIIALLGSVEEHWLKNNININSNQIISVDTHSEGIAQIKVKQADLIIIDTIVAKHYIKNNSNLDSRIIEELKLGTGFAVKKNTNVELLEKINTVLEEKEGEIQKIVDSYLLKD